MEICGGSVMDFREQLKNASRTESEYLSEEEKKNREYAKNSAESTYKTIKSEFLKVVSKGNYTEINGKKKATLYLGENVANVPLKNYVKYFSPFDFRKNISRNKTLRRGFFSSRTEISMTCTIVPDGYMHWDYFMKFLKELCARDSISVEPIIYDTDAHTERSAYFPCSMTDIIVSTYQFIVCLKCIVEY